MTNAVLSVTYTDVPGFPHGSAVAAIKATITGPAGPQTQSVGAGTASITFDNVVPGSYAYVVEAVDSGGNVYGTAVQGTFSVPEPPVTLSLPSAVTLTLV